MVIGKYVIIFKKVIGCECKFCAAGFIKPLRMVGRSWLTKSLLPPYARGRVCLCHGVQGESLGPFTHAEASLSHGGPI